MPARYARPKFRTFAAMAHSLSDRGRALVDKPLRDDFELFHDAEQNPFDPADNPSGAIPLCIAENVLSWPEMRTRLTELAGRPLPDWVAKYTDVKGAPAFREALAGFAGRLIAPLGGRDALALDPEGFAVSSGATAVVELTSLLLGDDGDVAAFPAPCYPVYAQDIGHKAHLGRYDVPCAEDWDGAEGVHPLTVADLDAARAEVSAQGKTLRMVVLTQPDNPTGAIYTEAQLSDFADWAIAHEVHLCVNELYALSQLDTTDARLADHYGADPAAYFSFLHLVERHRSPYLHWWYSFSKDFGISGLRCGALYSRNADFLQAFGNLGAPHTVSNHTQWLLAQLLADESWVAAFAKTNQQRLTDAYASVVAALRQNGVAYTPARGSLFVWARLNADGAVTDEAFWRKLYEDTGVLLTGPNGFGYEERGWLRIVYSCVEPAALAEAVRRLVARL